jgi:hypothetical protein
MVIINWFYYVNFLSVYPKLAMSPTVAGNLLIPLMNPLKYNIRLDALNHERSIKIEKHLINHGMEKEVAVNTCF